VTRIKAIFVVVDAKLRPVTYTEGEFAERNLPPRAVSEWRLDSERGATEKIDSLGAK
jgi:hypothetical protein